MPVCAFCQASVIDGMLFCAECGAALIPQIGGSRPTTARLLVPALNQSLELRGPGVWILGRKRGTTPDGAIYLDLSPYNAYELGVSRAHARLEIRRDGRGYLTDLASRNGTWVNGRRLQPHQPYPLPPVATLRLGRLKLAWYHPPS